MPDEMQDASDVDVDAILGPADAVPGIDTGGVDDTIKGIGAGGEDLGDAGVVDVDHPDQDADDRLPLAHSDIPDEAGVDAWFKEMSEADPEVAATVRQAWGGDAPLNLAFAASAFNSFATQELADLFDHAVIEGRDGEPVSLGAHPVLIEAMARIGRMIAREPGNPRSIKDTSTHGRRANMASNEEVIREKLDVIHSWQHSNDPKEQAKYRQPRTQRALDSLYRSLPGGDMPIVGRSLRQF